jgi:transcriptional regulator with XRE-family HTH domain
MTESLTDEAGQAAGRMILVRRGELGLTQQEVASRAGVNVDTVSDLENGKTSPRSGTVAAIARVLDLDGTELWCIINGLPVRAAS